MSGIEGAAKVSGRRTRRYEVTQDGGLDNEGESLHERRRQVDTGYLPYHVCRADPTIWVLLVWHDFVSRRCIVLGTDETLFTVSV